MIRVALLGMAHVHAGGYARQVQQNPEAEIVGSTNKERIVIRATDKAVSRMRSQYGDRLIIEPDATLDLFTK